MSREPATLDVHIGRLIRARRRAARWSQKALGAPAGGQLSADAEVRVRRQPGQRRDPARPGGAVRDAARGLFHGWDEESGETRRDPGADLLAAPGGAELAEAYLAIRSPRLRARVLALVGEIAGVDGVVRWAG